MKLVADECVAASDNGSGFVGFVGAAKFLALIFLSVDVSRHCFVEHPEN